MDITVKLRSVIDEEFRAEFMADPDAFGATAVPLPDAIEQLDREPADFWTEDVTANEICACASTCTYFANRTLYCESTAY